MVDDVLRSIAASEVFQPLEIFFIQTLCDLWFFRKNSSFTGSGGIDVPLKI